MRMSQTKDPHDWSIEEVVRHIREHDPALALHAKQFQEQVSCTVQELQFIIIIRECKSRRTTYCNKISILLGSYVRFPH